MRAEFEKETGCVTMVTETDEERHLMEQLTLEMVEPFIGRWKLQPVDDRALVAITEDFRGLVNRLIEEGRIHRPNDRHH